MIYKILIFLILLANSSCSTEKTVEQKKGISTQKSAVKTELNNVSNDSYKEQVLALFRIYRKSQSAAVSPKELDTELGKVTDPGLQKTKELITEFTKRDPDLVNLNFLSKPDSSTLAAIHHIEMVAINSFTTEAIDLKTLINDDIKSVSKDELLAKYYKILFTRLVRLTDKDFSNFNIQFDKLGLKTAKEKGTLLLVSMSIFGNNYFRTSKNGCTRAKAYLELLPTVEGQNIFEYRLQEFKDFLIILNRNINGDSFTKYYSSFYDNAKAAYSACN